MPWECIWLCGQPIRPCSHRTVSCTRVFANCHKSRLLWTSETQNQHCIRWRGQPREVAWNSSQVEWEGHANSVLCVTGRLLDLSDFSFLFGKTECYLLICWKDAMIVSPFHWWRDSEVADQHSQYEDEMSNWERRPEIKPQLPCFWPSGPGSFLSLKNLCFYRNKMEVAAVSECLVLISLTMLQE